MGWRDNEPHYSQIVDCKFSDLEGKTLSRVDRVGDEILEFHCTDGSRYWMGHYQDCCESVYIEDICGDLDTIQNCPIITADERTYDVDDSEQYTFYCLRTIKGTVDIRWTGQSEYYSVAVSFEKLKDNVEIVG
jgi:hypothetical protein